MIRIITALALRLFAMYVLTMVLLSSVAFLLQWQFGIPDLLGRDRNFLLLVLAVFVAAALIGVLLWRMGGSALCGAGELDAKSELVPVTITAPQMQRMLFAGLGTYFCVQAVIVLLNDLVARLDVVSSVAAPSEMLPLAWLVPLVELLIGIGFIAGAMGWRSLLQRVRGR